DSGARQRDRRAVRAQPGAHRPRGGDRQHTGIREPMKKRIVIIILLAAAATGIWLWRSGRFSKESNRILVSGNLEMTQVDLSFRIAGRLVALNVREGDRVKKGFEIA